MSSEKAKIVKNIKGIDHYSKNPIIDSLIKQKLQAEMKSVKNNFQQLLKQEEHKRKDNNLNKPTPKRTMSLQELTSLTPGKIKQSLTFHPAVSQETLAFVTQRQNLSPFYQSVQLQQLNKARTNNQNFFVKLQASDQLNLQHKEDPVYYEQLQQKLKQKLPTDLWLPSQPEVQEIITNRAERLENSSQSKRVFNLETTDRPLSEQFKPLRSNRSRNIKRPLLGSQNYEITYEPKKYNRTDYQSIQRWLQIAVDFVNKQAQSQSKGQQGQQGQQPIRQHLNQIFTIYMSSMKELIRLSYIESAEKGLILQKLIWSMLRLFQTLISQQHQLNYQEFKQFRNQLKQQKEHYQSKLQQLNSQLNQQSQQVRTITEQKGKIALICLTYKKVNEHMQQQFQEIAKSNQSLQAQNTFLSNKLVRIIQQFQQKQVIHLQKTKEQQLYYYLNQKHEKQIVAQVPYTNQHIDPLAALQQTLTSPPETLEQLENNLCNYWEKKRTYLQLDSLVKSLIDKDITHQAVQSDGRGPQEYQDTAVQHPKEGEETFEQFLKKQLEEQRQMWTAKERQYQSTQISLKDLYGQLKQTMEILSSQARQYKFSCLQKQTQLDFQTKKTAQQQQRVSLLSKKIDLLQAEISQHQSKQLKLKQEIAQRENRISEQKKKYYFQKQNNNLLTINIHQLKEEKENLSHKFQELENKIKAVAPALEKMMALPETTQITTLNLLSQLVEKHLGEYVEKDAQLFLTH